MRLVGDGGIEISVPKIVVERAARRAGMSIEEFVRTHRVVHLFNDFKQFDAAYRFEPISQQNQIEIVTEPEIE